MKKYQRSKVPSPLPNRRPNTPKLTDLDFLFGQFKTWLATRAKRFQSFEILGAVAESRKRNRLVLCRPKANRSQLFVLKRFEFKGDPRARASVLFEIATPLLVDSPWVLQPDDFFYFDQDKVNIPVREFIDEVY